MPVTDDPSAEDLGFGFRVRKDDAVEVRHRGRLAATLRGSAGREFLRQLEAATAAQGQQLMARLTGNYKRGNERLASRHDPQPRLIPRGAVVARAVML